MKVQLERNQDFVETNRVVIGVGDINFLIHVNNCGELVVNKYSYGTGSNNIMILPSTSNEIRIN